MADQVGTSPACLTRSASSPALASGPVGAKASETRRLPPSARRNVTRLPTAFWMIGWDGQQVGGREQHDSPYVCLCCKFHRGQRGCNRKQQQPPPPEHPNAVPVRGRHRQRRRHLQINDQWRRFESISQGTDVGQGVWWRGVLVPRGRRARRQRHAIAIGFAI